MKKTIQLLGALVCAVLILGISTGTIHARIGDNDAWCVGAAGAEVCVDSSGNLAPTTDNDVTLGTSALRWATGYIVDLTIGDDLTVSGDTTVTGDVTVGGDLFHTAIATATLGAAGTISLVGACNGLVRLDVTADRTTNTTNTFTAPTAANTGCHYTILNTGGGTITLDDNALFDVPANVVLGTNDGAYIVQGSVSHILLGTSDN